MDVPRKVLLIQIVKLGDVLLSSALLDDLRAFAPDAELHLLTYPNAAPLVANHPLVARRWDYRESRVPALLWQLRRERFDLVVDVQSSAASAPLVAATGAAVRVGWRIRPPWVWAYTHTVPRGGRESEFVLRERRLLLEAIGIPAGDTGPRLFLTDLERRDAARTWEALGLHRGQHGGPRGGRPLVGISLSASVPMKEWPVERWAEVADALARAGAQPVVLLAAGDEAKAASFAARTNAAVLVPPRDLRGFAALLPDLAVFVSPDTGPAHMAMALGTPTVTLYTPGNARRWNPGRHDTTAIEAPALPRCPECAIEPLARRERLVHHCVPRIRVDDVVGATCAHLERHPARTGLPR